MHKCKLTIGLLCSLSAALVFSLPDQASKLSGGRKAAEAASAVGALVNGTHERSHFLNFLETHSTQRKKATLGQK